MELEQLPFDTATPTAVAEAAARRLLRAVPADIWCAVLLDPATLLDTGGVHHSGFPEAVMPRLFEIEHVEQQGTDALRAMARRPDPVSALSISAGGGLDGNVYFEDVLKPVGMADELRVLLREGGRVWGLLVLCRASRDGFGAKDLAAARSLAGPAARRLRQVLVATGLDVGAADGTGLLVLDQDQRITSCSPTAQRLLARIDESASAGGPKQLPYTLRAVAAAAARPDGGGEPATARVRARDGAWLTVQAWRIEPGGVPSTTVVIGPAEPGTLAALVLDAYGLSLRQREVAQLILLGRSSQEIIDELHITRNTLNNHLEKIFDKVGVRSRRELPAALFSRHYLPRLGVGPLAYDGRQIPQDPAVAA